MTDCFICGGRPLQPSTRDYLRCPDCGHEVLRDGQAQRIMVNDALEAGKGVDSLIRFQTSVVERARLADRFLVDVGSGSGRFLAHNRGRFDAVLGVEISPDSVRYAVDVLKLPVLPALPDDLSTPSVVTFWHSLEHVPAEKMDGLLDRLNAAADVRTRIVVSVPNAASFQCLVFKENYAYYDAPNHLHQFSPRSLDLLLKRHGFERAGSFFSPLYVLFGYVQGLLNLAAPFHNYFYYRRKRGSDFGLSTPSRTLLDLVNILLMPLFLPIGAVLSLADLAIPDRSGVLTLCYKKTGSIS